MSYPSPLLVYDFQEQRNGPAFQSVSILRFFLVRSSTITGEYTYEIRTGPPTAVELHDELDITTLLQWPVSVPTLQNNSNLARNPATQHEYFKNVRSKYSAFCSIADLCLAYSSPSNATALSGPHTRGCQTLKRRREMPGRVSPSNFIRT